jgi:D-tyrosyl-tRNA(Tyr) deacylase
MRVIIQRVKKGSVSVNGYKISSIEKGIVLFLGIENNDTITDIEWMCTKVSQLRIFDDENKIMNKSLIDIDGDILIISQFTLHASTKKGNRPSYIKAAKSEFALKIYNEFLDLIKQKIKKNPCSGVFGANMLVKIEYESDETISNIFF